MNKIVSQIESDQCNDNFYMHLNEYWIQKSLHFIYSKIFINNEQQKSFQKSIRIEKDCVYQLNNGKYSLYELQSVLNAYTHYHIGYCGFYFIDISDVQIHLINEPMLELINKCGAFKQITEIKRTISRHGDPGWIFANDKDCRNETVKRMDTIETLTLNEWYLFWKDKVI